ncbi:caspase family protein [Bradyrhizobium sp. LHD-71]|uniref:caspase family protein n=1 Tax=Bradyrhizobium sp. LHD-71 TaxID=3072141 RepID=UPI00280E3771|nr:caspase family protein [Bradyrhizobium sp. LHD-71]MDQ8728626.1 caspase family protein [Bradyrhizobium sp. LHD-71]
MSALYRSSLGSRLLAAAFACFLAIGTPTPAPAGPILAQTETPNFGRSRAAEVPAPAASADENAQQSADVGNPAPARGAERRVALVIGNSAYEHVTALPNPANDAKAIGQLLNSAGFEVIQATNLDHDEMIQVLQDFSARISERGPNTVAFVYYAGHGLQIAGDNYLVPVDARIASEADVSNATVRLVDVMATLQAVPSRMRIVVLDACRNNPFSQLKDTGRGLAIVDAPNGSIVGYSTAPGTEAFDGEGQNSPYTQAFLRLGREQNLPIEQFFKKVRVVVNDVTEGRQTPWESSSLTSDFYFFGDTAVAEAKTVDPALSANASADKPAVVAQNMRSRTPREAYSYAIAENSVEHYQEFVRIYPYDPFANHIRRLLTAKLLAAAWHRAVLANSPIVYKDFYSKYADSPYAKVAMKLAVQPKAMPLYQPTKIMVAPQIAQRVGLGSFNGVNVPQGNNAPVGLGGAGSLFTKKFGSTQGFGTGPDAGQKLGLPGRNGGQGASLPDNGKPLVPGVDLAKGVKRFDTAKRFDTKIGGGRLKTPTGTNQSLNDRANGSPLIKRFDRPRVTNLGSNETSTVKRLQTGRRSTFAGNNGSGSNFQFRSAKPASFGGGGSSAAGRFAGGAGFGRSFR